MAGADVMMPMYAPMGQDPLAAGAAVAAAPANPNPHVYAVNQNAMNQNAAMQQMLNALNVQNRNQQTTQQATQAAASAAALQTERAMLQQQQHELKQQKAEFAAMQAQLLAAAAAPPPASPMHVNTPRVNTPRVVAAAPAAAAAAAYAPAAGAGAGAGAGARPIQPADHKGIDMETLMHALQQLTAANQQQQARISAAANQQSAVRSERTLQDGDLVNAIKALTSSASLPDGSDKCCAVYQKSTKEWVRCSYPGKQLAHPAGKMYPIAVVPRDGKIGAQIPGLFCGRHSNHKCGENFAGVAEQLVYKLGTQEQHLAAMNYVSGLYRAATDSDAASNVALASASDEFGKDVVGQIMAALNNNRATGQFVRDTSVPRAPSRRGKANHVSVARNDGAKKMCTYCHKYAAIYDNDRCGYHKNM